MICDNCASSFDPRTVTQRFCQSRCHQQYNARQANRGRALVEHAMLWRLSRDGHYLTEISRMIDRWLREDEKRVGSAQQAKRVYQARARRRDGRRTLIDA